MKLKAILILILSGLLTTNGLAQYMQYYTSTTGEYLMPDVGLTSTLLKKRIAKLNVQVMELQFSKSKKNNVKPNGISWYTFDKKGNVIQRKEVNKKGKVNSNTFTVYTKDNKIKEQWELNNKNDTLWHKYFSYNDSSKLTNYQIFNKKGKLQRQHSTIYAADTQVISQDFYKKGKLEKRWEYAYHPNGERSESKLINRKGKIKGVWSYECKEEGAEIKKHKDTSTVCHTKELDANGNRTEIYQRTDPDGEIRKTITVYNKFNLLVSMKSTEGIDDKMLYQQNNEYLSDSMLISCVYKTYWKGKLQWERTVQYNKDGQTTSDRSKSYKKGKVKGYWVREFVFDSDGLLVQHISNNQTKDVKYSQVVSYVKAK